MSQAYVRATGNLTRAANAAAESFAALAETLRAKPHLYPLPWHCSAGCGEPIRMGEMHVQTSPNLNPLTREHAACVAGRKGSDGNREVA